jgi:cob(I)alamin adenosyltransferase
MVKLNKIYTRTGDDGSTGLADGSRTDKDSPRVEAYGAVDEANAAIGLARSSLDHAQLDVILERIQNDLFDLGADLSTPDRGQKLEYEPLRIATSQVARVEADIDALNAELEPLKSFVLPAGSHTAAALHMARTLVRRAERKMWTLSREDHEHVSDAALHYANRVSDLLFVAARVVNKDRGGDVLWKPGEHR